MLFVPLYGRRVLGVNVRKTVGDGALGSVGGGLGRRRYQIRIARRERRTRFIGVIAGTLGDGY